MLYQKVVSQVNSLYNLFQPVETMLKLDLRLNQRSISISEDRISFARFIHLFISEHIFSVSLDCYIPTILSICNSCVLSLSPPHSSHQYTSEEVKFYAE